MFIGTTSLFPQKNLSSNIQVTIFDSFRRDFLKLAEASFPLSHKFIFIDVKKDIWLDRQILTEMP